MDRPDVAVTFPRPECGARSLPVSWVAPPARPAFRPFLRAPAAVGEAQVAWDVSLTPPVADLPTDHQRLLVTADGPLHLAQVLVGDSQVAQGVALAPPVADLPRDDQPL